MQVRDVMMPRVPLGDETHTLEETARQMRAQGTEAIVFTRGDDHIVGIVTTRELVAAIAAGHDPRTTRAEEHLRNDLPRLRPDMDVGEAHSIAESSRFSHLPVVDAGFLVGLVDVRDLSGPREEGTQEILTPGGRDVPKR